VCPTNYGPTLGEGEINICAPSDCSLRTPNTPTLCLVFEDVDSEVECLKISDNTCNAQCPTNYDPVLSLQGGTCVIAECASRVPLEGSCYMAGDNPSYLCYSLEELNRCYNTCPLLTIPNVTVPNKPRCDAVPCDSRVPDSRGVCAIEPFDRCYIYQGACYSQCPGLTSPLPDQNV
jgi:hypothetical protein